MIQSSRRVLLLVTLSCAIATGTPVIGQADTPAPVKAPAFEVVSIKPNNSGMDGSAWGVSQNKYSARNTPLSRVILQAYLGQMAPSGERLKGAPAWVSTDPYDITAKVDDATAESWKGLQQAQQIALAAPMLRAMLEDRCKLAAHTVPTEIQGYALVIGKRGIKMNEAQPGEPVPTRVAKFQGGWMMVPSMPGDPKQGLTFLQINMAQFTAYLGMGGVPIVDQTGLTGMYDFELPRFDMPPPSAEGAAPAPRPDISQMFDWSAVGLELKPIKVPALDLVIDHIERPTAN